MIEWENFMLVLTRKTGESIVIDDHIKIVVVQVKGKQVRLGIQAPQKTKIHREEIYPAVKQQNHVASSDPENEIFPNSQGSNSH